MYGLLVTNFIFFLLFATPVYSQHQDSTLDNLQQIPAKYISDIDKKIQQYSSRITGKTEKTLTKLSRWENKIKGMLQKTSPETAERLFGNNQLTFTSLLQQIKHGEEIVLSYKAPYNKYRDDITTSLKYLALQKEQFDSNIIKKVKATSGRMRELTDEEDKSEALQQFIKARKNILIEQAFQLIGKNKYLSKINKEAYYYTETLKNYRELFNDSKKAEQTAKTILNKIPAFQQFMQKNSQLASLFGSPGGGIPPGGAGIAGLQTRASVQSIIQGRISGGGPSARQAISQNIQAAQAELTKLKDKILKSAPGVGGEGGMPDFKPNEQKTKTFKQRLEYGFNMQFAKTGNLLPASSEIALSMGYQIISKSVIGAAVSYKLGIGNIQHIRITHEGIGLRSFIDWKVSSPFGRSRGDFFISGGYELNHNAQFENIAQLKNYDAWQRSALIGLTKKIKINTKWFKSTNAQLLYDFLAEKQVPQGQTIKFRIGYTF